MSLPETNLHALISPHVARIEQALDDWLPLPEPKVSGSLNEAVRYSVLAGGKRIRGMLCLMVAEATGTPSMAALRTGCALELIHAYSLIHDDLPAMDNDDYRRGKPSNHKAFGEATAILAGDSLLTLAFEWLATLSQYGANESQCLQILTCVAKAAGHSGMIGGQMLDMHHEVFPASVEELQRIHTQKTGALISAPILCGAVLLGASEQDSRVLNEFSHKLGLLFQIVDDILDVEGDFALLGKTPGKDAGSGKSTYTSLLGIDKARELACKTHKESLLLLDQLSIPAQELKVVADIVFGRKN